MSTFSETAGWLLFFYSVPAKPAGNRIRIWRRLAKIGAIGLKGGVYLLPDDEEHRETLQWLISETSSLGGEAGFAAASRIHPYRDSDLPELFNRQRAKEYEPLAAAAESFRRSLTKVRQGAATPKSAALARQFQKIRNDFQSVRAIDFFDSPQGFALGQSLNGLEPAVRELLAGKDAAKPASFDPNTSLRIADYQDRTWVTRPRPFVDRMASAWLIRRCIDPGARFAFLPEQEIAATAGDMLSFDVDNGDFTHLGDLCTFEVLAARFGIKDPGVRHLGEIVHDLDLRDARFGHPEAFGVETVLTGIRAAATSDQEMLDQGFLVFDALRAAREPK